MSATPEAPLILVVDDEDDVREIVAFRLERAGYRVISAVDGHEAVAMAVAHAPALAVVDVMMPGMTGWEVTRTLKADPRTASTAVILLTARSRDADISRGFDAGADDYIRKPFSPEELGARVKATLTRR
jgi:DNA-binding response OmpR family regulator